MAADRRSLRAARRAGELVVSMEGPETAGEGDWVIKARRGPVAHLGRASPRLRARRRLTSVRTGEQPLGQSDRLAQGDQVAAGKRLRPRSRGARGPPEPGSRRETVCPRGRLARSSAPTAIPAGRTGPRTASRPVPLRRPPSPARRPPAAGRAGRRCADRTARRRRGRPAHRWPGPPPAARCCPTTRRPSRRAAGTIALTSTSQTTGSRSQASGALKPPSDCATSTTREAEPQPRRWRPPGRSAWRLGRWAGRPGRPHDRPARATVPAGTVVRAASAPDTGRMTTSPRRRL